MYAFIVLGGYFLLAFAGGMGLVYLLPFGKVESIRHLPNAKIGPFRFHFQRDIRSWQWLHFMPTFGVGGFLGVMLLYILRILSWSYLQPEWAIFISLLLIFPIEFIACKLADV